MIICMWRFLHNCSPWSVDKINFLGPSDLNFHRVALLKECLLHTSGLMVFLACLIWSLLLSFLLTKGSFTCLYLHILHVETQTAIDWTSQVLCGDIFHHLLKTEYFDRKVKEHISIWWFDQAFCPCLQENCSEWFEI